jgi:hypothetical protein
VFDGAVGRLDQAITTASLSPKVTAAVEWHINADESLAHDYNLEFKKPACSTCAADPYQATPYRSSDHDPVVMGLNLFKSVAGTSGRDTLVGTSGDDVIEGGVGADTLTGGGGNNQFVFTSMLDAGDVITDFAPGKDVLVLTKLLASLGIASADPVATGHVTCAATAAGAVISIDADGSAGTAQRPRSLVQLKGVACSALTSSSYKF